MKAQYIEASGNTTLKKKQRGAPLYLTSRLTVKLQESNSVVLAKGLANSLTELRVQK